MGTQRYGNEPAEVNVLVNVKNHYCGVLIPRAGVPGGTRNEESSQPSHYVS